MREDLGEILKSAEFLHRLLTMSPTERQVIEQARLRQGDLTTINEEIRAALSSILERSAELVTFLDRFESSPLIYTGEGSTQEVLAKLQRLATIAKENGENL